MRIIVKGSVLKMCQLTYAYFYQIVLLSVANWGLPLAAIADAKLTPEKISGKMTTG